jgi:bifunctional DNase/RNase
MQWIELQVAALNTSESMPGHFVLVLEEPATRKRLPIIIGAFEAQAIAMYMEKLNPPRPLTHDLFANTLQQMNVKLRTVCIYGIESGAFAAKLEWQDAQSVHHSTDARTSDAIALGIRMNANILIDAELFSRFAISEIKRQGMLRGSLLEYSLEELEILLSDLLEKEDYESAARVRDIIGRKKADGNG